MAIVDLVGMLIGLPLALGLLAFGLWLVGRISATQGRRGPDASAHSRGLLGALVVGGLLGRKRD